MSNHDDGPNIVEVVLHRYMSYHTPPRTREVSASNMCRDQLEAKTWSRLLLRGFLSLLSSHQLILSSTVYCINTNRAPRKEYLVGTPRYPIQTALLANVETGQQTVSARENHTPHTYMLYKDDSRFVAIAVSTAESTKYS